MRSTTRAAAAIAVTALLAVVCFTGSAWAGHQFADVSSGHPFHDEIARIADAGITTGFEDGTYRPGAAVSRGAMAAFMARGFSSISSDAAQGVNLTHNTPIEVVGTSIRAGAAEGGTGYVVVDVTGTAFVGASELCPCTVLYSISQSPLDEGQVLHLATVPGQEGEGGQAGVALAVQEVVPVEGDATTTYYLIARMLDTNAIDVAVQATITAMYVPFAGEPPS
jgi:hypothetical protein